MSFLYPNWLHFSVIRQNPARAYMSLHTPKLREVKWIKRENKHSSQTGVQWVTCAGSADTVSSLFKSLCGDFPSGVITTHIHNPRLFGSHK